MDEARLRAKLERIEALFAGAAIKGEQMAAAEARQRILARLRAVEHESPPVEYRFRLGDVWARKLFLGLLRRYDLKPYRFAGQRYTTVMVKVSKRFVDETLWPEFQQLSATLRTYLDEVTERVVREALHGDSSEAEEVAAPRVLAAPNEGAHRLTTACPTRGSPISMTSSTRTVSWSRGVPASWRHTGASWSRPQRASRRYLGAVSGALPPAPGTRALPGTHAGPPLG